MDWKQSFASAALEKGWQLYQENKISGISKNGDVYFGLVQDQEETDLIQAQIENGQIITIECSCPDSFKGELCSHEAAFLFKLEDYSDLNEIEDISFHEEEIPEPKKPQAPKTEKEITEASNIEKENHSAGQQNMSSNDLEPEKRQETLFQKKEERKSEPQEEAKKPEDKNFSENENPDGDTFIETPNRAPEKTASFKPLKNRFEKFIDKIPEEELRQFVYHYASSHERFKQKLTIEFSSEFPEEIMDTLLDELDEIIAKAKGKTGLINEYNRDFVDEYEECIKDAALSMIQNDYLQEAFSFLTYSLNNVLDEDIYEEVAQSIYASALKWIEAILEKADEHVTSLIFTWLENQLEQGKLLFDRDVENLWLSHFQFEPYITALENYVDKKINERISDQGKRRYFGYGLDRYLLYKYQILKKDPRKESESAQLLKEYSSNPEFYLKVGKEMFEKEEYEALKKWFEDYKVHEELSAYDKLTASHLLRKVYKLEGNEVSYLDELSFALKNLGESSLDAILEYKNLAGPEDWDSMYAYLQYSLSDFAKADLYANLNELELLIELMEANSDSKYFIEDYSDQVKKAYPQRTAKLYLQLAKHAVEEGKGRKDYAQAMHYLHTAKEIYPMHQEIQNLIQDWKTQYRRRSSLMHEIAQSGFDH